MMDNEIFATVNAHAEQAKKKRRELELLDLCNSIKETRAKRFLRSHYEHLAVRKAYQTALPDAFLAGVIAMAVLVIVLFVVM